MVAPSFDTSRAQAAYASAFQQLAALPGFSQKEVLRAEAGVILKTWAGRTPIAKQEKSDRTSRLQLISKFHLTRAGNSNVTINAGVRGPVGFIWNRGQSGKFRLAGKIAPDASSVQWSNYHFRDTEWNAILEAGTTYADNIAGYISRGRRSAGLACQSIVQIANALGIDLAQVSGGNLSATKLARAQSALASNGRAYQNGIGMEGGDETAGYIDLINSLPYGRKIGMDRTLAGVLAGRAGYIKQSYAHGAFNSMARVAAAFPNLITVNPPSFAVAA